MTTTEPAQVAEPQTMLADYRDHVVALGLGERSVRGRTAVATAFLAAHPDLHAWMTLPAPVRLAELKQTRAWPLLCHVIGRDDLTLDIELATVKHLTGLGKAIEARDPGGFAAARSIGLGLGWTSSWVETVLGQCLAVVLAHHGGMIAELTAEMIDEFDAAIAATTTVRPSSQRSYRIRVRSMRQLLFEMRVIDTAPARRRWARSHEQHFDAVDMPEQVRETLLRYVTARSAVLRPKSVESLINDLLPFAEYLTDHHPAVTSLRQLTRAHVEGFLVWNRTRGWRGQRAAAGAGRSISPAVAHAAVLSLRNLLDDITAWDWDHAPQRRLVFAADVPKLGQPLPRALAPDIDAALMDAIGRLDDSFAHIALTILRETGLRVGELLDLEVGSVVDYGPAGTWIKAPLGKLATERMVPLPDAALSAFDEWAHCREACRPLAHPRTGQPTDFLFVNRGHRLGYTRLRNGLIAAAEHAGLRGPGGTVLVVTPHQLRHTWATELANAGMSLQALMALLGHVTPQMTICYATLASPTLRTAYDEAMGKMRRQFTLTPVDKPIVPDTVTWLGAEMLKTRVAHGYCSRHEAAGACPYANICETCDNFVTGPEFRGALQAQLSDVHSPNLTLTNAGGPARRLAITGSLMP